MERLASSRNQRPEASKQSWTAVGLADSPVPSPVRPVRPGLWRAIGLSSSDDEEAPESFVEHLAPAPCFPSRDESKLGFGGAWSVSPAELEARPAQPAHPACLPPEPAELEDSGASSSRELVNQIDRQQAAPSTEDALETDMAREFINEIANNPCFSIPTNLIINTRRTYSDMLHDSRVCIENRLQRHGPTVFKIGITRRPYYRYNNAEFGYQREGYSLLEVLCCSTPDTCARLEKALITTFKGRLGCRNDNPGGENPPKNPPCFLYCCSVTSECLSNFLLSCSKRRQRRSTEAAGVGPLLYRG